MSIDLQLRIGLQRAGFSLDVDLNLPGRGVTALFGPSGSGKTSCLRVLAGLEPRAQGRISVAGEVWQDSAQGIFKPVHQRALGYVFQEASLFDHLNVERNIRYGFERTPAAQRRHGWDHALALLGIGHLLARMPHELSGGERQRVAMARALASSPKVLLMDEPLAALDTQRKTDILPWLEQLHERLDIPVLYVTHSVEEVTRLADHLVLLQAGQVLASGALIDLLTRLDLPLAQGDNAAALIEAEVGTDAPSEQLTALVFEGGRLLIPSTGTTPTPPGKRVRLRIQARDVSLSLLSAQYTSILNILSATVVDLADDGCGQVLVGLSLGDGPQPLRLLSRISRYSAQALQIAPGLALYAQIKGVALVR